MSIVLFISSTSITMVTRMRRTSRQIGVVGGRTKERTKVLWSRLQESQVQLQALHPPLTQVLRMISPRLLRALQPLLALQTDLVAT